MYKHIYCEELLQFEKVQSVLRGSNKMYLFSSIVINTVAP